MATSSDGGGNRNQVDKDYGYCHHCKQLKKLQFLAECKYDSEKMGHQSPISYTANDVTIYNVDMMNMSSLTHLVLKEMQSDGKNQFKADSQTINLLNKCF